MNSYFIRHIKIKKIFTMLTILLLAATPNVLFMDNPNNSNQEESPFTTFLNSISCSPFFSCTSTNAFYHEQNENPSTNAVFDQTECSICLIEFEIGEKVSLLHCKHLYHKKCIKQWLKKPSTEPFTCPLCRKKILETVKFQPETRKDK